MRGASASDRRIGRARAVAGAAGALVLLLSAPAGTQQQQPPEQGQPTPTFRGGTNLVRVDVVATDKSGAPVGDLKVDDFEIREDGKRQTIETFRLLSLGGDDASVPINATAFDDDEAARDDVRVFGMFLDDYHTSSRASRIAGEMLARFVENGLVASDMVGIMHPLTLLSDVRINRERAGTAKELRAFVGRRNNFAPINAGEEAYVTKFPRDIGRIRREVSLSALKGFILRLGALKDGRKTIVIVSEGYSAGEASVYGELKEVADLASRYNTALYTVNPNILPPRQQWSATAGADTLTYLAEQTGGRAIFDQTKSNEELRLRNRGTMPRSNLGPALHQILIDASANYLLGYRSAIDPPDDKLHKIVVTVKRRNVELRHRQGWWSNKPEPVPVYPRQPSIVDNKAMQNALSAAVQPRGRLIRTWIGTRGATDGRTQVSFVWEPMAAPAGSAARESDRPVRVRLTATDANKATIFSASLTPPGGDARGSFAAFDVPPSTIQLRWFVENSAAEVLDSETRQLVVPDFSGAQAELGTAEVFRARTLTDMQRIKGDVRAVPTAVREFSRAEWLLVRVAAHSGGQKPSGAIAQLVSRSGRLVADLTLTYNATLGTIETDVPLATVPPGDYAVRIHASDAIPDELVAFRIVN